MYNLENIGKRLRTVREMFKYTQRRMAGMVNIQEVTYKKNEKGLHLVHLKSLERLHEDLNISIEWVLFGNGPIYWQDIRAKKEEVKDAGLMKRDIFREEVAEMIDILERIPVIRHSVMGHYQDCKIRYKDLLAEAAESK